MRRRNRYRSESLAALIQDFSWRGWILVAALTFVVLFIALVLVNAVTHRAPNQVDAAVLLLFPLGLLFLGVTGLPERRRRRQRLERATSLQRLQQLTGSEFEELCIELYRRGPGLITPNRRPDEEDGGVDFEVERADKRFLVQCKHWRWESVGVKEARELWGVVASERASGGILITSGSFTSAARAFASGLAGLELIEGIELLRRLHQVQATGDAVSMADRDWVMEIEFAVRLGKTARPACPMCAKPQILVTRLRDARVESQFWGCVDYPECKGTRRLRPIIDDPVRP